MRRIGVRRIDGVVLVDLFMVSGICSVLVTRAYLAATGYPQVGNGTLHIAHAVWGGLLMAVAIMAALSLLARAAQPVIAIGGGIGFGLFIDELGKFITQDVDYFFAPTAALIYLTFILMYLGARVLVERPQTTAAEWLANAAALAGEGASRPLSPGERRALERMLEESPSDHALTAALRAYAEEAPVGSESAPRWWRRLADGFLARYHRVVLTRWFARLVALVAIGYALGALVQIAALVVGDGDLADLDAQRAFVRWAATVASLAQGVLTIVGVAHLRRSREAAYAWLERALLVNIFLVQVFLFAEEQFTAVSGLLVSLVALAVVRTLHAAETADEADRPPRARLVPGPIGGAGGS